MGASKKNLTGRSKSQVENEDEDHDFSTPMGLPLDEMVKNLIYYALTMQGKLHPMRKSDIIKLTMNKQASDFRAVIGQASDLLWEDFGLKLVGMKNDTNEECDVMEGTAFILISKFRDHGTVMISQAQKGYRKDLSKAVLLIILSCSYMTDSLLDEDTIWTILEKLELAEELCKNRDFLRRTFKSEYVDTMYLAKYEEKTADSTTVRYGWGFRAHQEYSKYCILKFVAEMFKKSPKDFPSNFAKISKHEIRKIDEEDESIRAGNEDVMPSSSNEDEDEESITEVEVSKVNQDHKSSSGSKAMDAENRRKSKNSKGKETEPKKTRIIPSNSASDSSTEEEN